MGDIDELLKGELKDEEFAKAWEESDLEYQIKRMLISAKIEKQMTQKGLAEKSGVSQPTIN